MNEQVEKLVEEISERIQFVADIGLQNFQATSVVEWARERERRGLALARELITRIGKAYADGMPLPGEIERRYVSSFYDVYGSLRFEYDLDTLLIALSPSGIPVEGKEEEK